MSQLPSVVTAQMDSSSVSVTSSSLWTRSSRLSYPSAVVFDEVYYGQFVSLYMKRMFFIDDSGPPLGHMISASGAYSGGFDGNFAWNRIGAEYPCTVSVWSSRSSPASAGASCVPSVYSSASELRCSYSSASGAASSSSSENSSIVQSRFMSSEPLLIFFVLSAFFSYSRFHNAPCRSWPRCVWLLSSGVSCGAAVGVKYTGSFSYSSSSGVASYHSWKSIGRRAVSHVSPAASLCGSGGSCDPVCSDPVSSSQWNVFTQCVSKVSCSSSVPLSLYVFWFYVHSSVLHRSGPHDQSMSSAFQASSQGGLSRITQGQPSEVAYGSQVTLRSSASQPLPCWLHSHKANYPIRYENGRGSSHQQQVTCYPFKDVNNWWIIKDPGRQDSVVDTPPRPVRHGHVVQSVHGMTSRLLNSHDVAAPMSPHAQEVSGYVDFNVSMAAQNSWRVDIYNREAESEVWKTIVSEVRSVHVNTSAVLKVSGAASPDWGFRQSEVVAEKSSKAHSSSLGWTVEEHRYGTSQEQKEREAELHSPTHIDVDRKISFWSKFSELQWKMSTVKQEESEHKYSSAPLEWITMDTNIAYWSHASSNAQIHLIGNPVSWGVAKLSLSAYQSSAAAYMSRRRRGFKDSTDDAWQQFVSSGFVCVGGWMMNFLPFLSMDKTLFSYHYSPASCYSYSSSPASSEHVHTHSLSSGAPRRASCACASAVLVSVVFAHWSFRPSTYGSPESSANQSQASKWRDSWDISYRRR